MKRDNPDFLERITLDINARRIACKILGVDELADKSDLKKAYRRLAVKFHPDKNSDDPDADRKFTLVKCAYQLLAEDIPCPGLLKEINSWSGVPEDDKHKLDNPWGHFLWWREKYFNSKNQKGSNGKRSSCI